MSRDPSKLAAVIPAYQAAPWIADVVHRTLAVVPRLLVIDDGSSDATAEAAAAAGAEVERLTLNAGKAAALRRGFECQLAAGAGAVVTLDADGQHLPEQIPRLVAAWRGGADLVLGIRSHLFAAMSPVRRASNRLSTGAISAAAGVRLHDIQTGFRIYDRRLLETVPFRGERFSAESAVVVRAARRGLEIAEVPVELARADGRATSHYRPIADSLRIASAVTRARLEGRP